VKNSVKTILASGEYSPGRNTFQARGITGWVEVGVNSALDAEEYAALVAKFGQSMADKVGIKMDAEAAAKLAAEIAAEAGTVADSAAKKAAQFAPKAQAWDGGTLGTNIRHGMADD